MKFILLFLLSTTCFAGTYNPGNLTSPAQKRTIVAALITNGGACAIGSQTGGWVQSVSHTATGQCDIDITGYFSAAPNCLVQGISSWGFLNAVITSTTIVAQTRVGNTPTDADFYVICDGVK